MATQSACSVSHSKIGCQEVHVEVKDGDKVINEDTSLAIEKVLMKEGYLRQYPVTERYLTEIVSEFLSNLKPRNVSYYKLCYYIRGKQELAQKLEKCPAIKRQQFIRDSLYDIEAPFVRPFLMEKIIHDHVEVDPMQHSIDIRWLIDFDLKLCKDVPNVAISFYDEHVYTDTRYGIACEALGLLTNSVEYISAHKGEKFYIESDDHDESVRKYFYLRDIINALRIVNGQHH